MMHSEEFLKNYAKALTIVRVIVLDIEAAQRNGETHISVNVRAHARSLLAPEMQMAAGMLAALGYILNDSPEDDWKYILLN